ncbi:MAG: pyridoxamine 5'-phosphate oxidase family protein [Clostridiales Family XIII bacterium]|nr:pyridoxamine 5'-phosphate oxidase family protein [Clostridiales Family XIII bacterium]
MSDSVKKVFDFLNGKTFYVATVDGGKPRVRPFGFVAVIDGKLYFGNNPEKPSYKQLKANPNIEISATSEDGTAWVRVSATAVYDERQEAIDASLAAYPALKDIYGAPGSPPFAPFYLKDATAVFASFTAPPETVTF